MALPEGEASGTPPHWIIYIGTPDVDATAAAAQRLGGKVLKSASDIPNVGRFAVLADPQGAAFAAFTPLPGSSDDAAAPTGAVGEFTWHELATTDPDSALRFYSELFGWAKGAAHDMGPMGVYQIISHRGQDVGGIYKARDASTPPSWLSYVRVNDAAKAASAVKTAGGRVLNGPIEVPGGSWIVMLLDPQGGSFAVAETPEAAAARATRASQTAKKSAASRSSRPDDKPRAAAQPAAPARRKMAASKPAVKKAPSGKAPRTRGPKKKTAANTKKAAQTRGRHLRKGAARRAAPKKRAAAKRGTTSAKRGPAKKGKRVGLKRARSKNRKR
jgi:predicted enzyme related to lactoylglutathione lyase